MDEGKENLKTVQKMSLYKNWIQPPDRQQNLDLYMKYYCTLFFLKKYSQ